MKIITGTGSKLMKNFQIFKITWCEYFLARAKNVWQAVAGFDTSTA
jgi:hypothetical protein